MEAGQQGKKTGAVIQARMQSERLPGKILMSLPLDNGKPMLQWIVDSLKECKSIDEIILATTVNPEDDILEKFAKTNGIPFFRGSDNDVLKRFADVAELFRLDTIIRATGDNPVLDSLLLDQLIQQHHLQCNDYTYSSNLPLGMNVEIVKADLLKAIINYNDLTYEDREHVTYYIKRKGTYKTQQTPLWPVSLTEKIRVTVDYPADYAAISLLLTFSAINQLKGMNLINWVNEKYKWIWEINSSSYQKRSYKTLDGELLAAIKILEQFDLNQAAQVLKAKLQG